MRKYDPGQTPWLTKERRHVMKRHDMKRTVAASLAALMLVPVISGCQGQSGTSGSGNTIFDQLTGKTSENASASEETLLKFYEEKLNDLMKNKQPLGQDVLDTVFEYKYIKPEYKQNIISEMDKFNTNMLELFSSVGPGVKYSLVLKVTDSSAVEGVPERLSRMSKYYDMPDGATYKEYTVDACLSDGTDEKALTKGDRFVFASAEGKIWLVFNDTATLREVNRENLESLGDPDADSSSPDIDYSTDSTPAESSYEEDSVMDDSMPESSAETPESSAETSDKASKPTALSGPTYKLEGTTLTVESDAFFDYDCLTLKSTSSSAEDAGKADSVTDLVIEPGVTYIDDSAFVGYTSLKTVSLPDTLTSIGKNAFSMCSSLRNVKVPDKVTEIGAEAFLECNKLVRITLPEGLTAIEEGVFKGCNSMKSITLPSKLKSIGKKSFERCTSIHSITIPETVTSIGEGAFEYCVSLQTTNIPDGVEKIEPYTFYHCNILKPIDLPKGLTSIGDYAFEVCYGIDTLTIPSGVSSVGEHVFNDWGSGQTIRIEGKTEAPSGWSAGWNSGCSAKIEWGV